jgi:hypothetical protein
MGGTAFKECQDAWGCNNYIDEFDTDITPEEALARMPKEHREALS